MAGVVVEMDGLLSADEEPFKSVSKVVTEHCSNDILAVSNLRHLLFYLKYIYHGGLHFI